MSPKLSIGLPVYNGENFLAEAVNSILSQTFSDFELIISDNASTDRTEELCRAYAQNDERVRYYRNPKNIGIARNYNITYELSSQSSDLFKWAAHDDVLMPGYLERCVELLDKEPSIVCVHTYTQKIDQYGTVKENYPDDQFTDSSQRVKRFHDVICKTHQVIVGHAVIRKSVLDKTKLFGAYPGADWALQAEIALYGRLYEIPEYLFKRRSHPHRAYRVPLYDRIALEDPAKAGKIVLPAWLQWFGYFAAVKRAKLPFGERLHCSMQAMKCLYRSGIGLRYSLARDLKWAAGQIFHRKKREPVGPLNAPEHKKI
jgi:glycosyltransferase involved in cell wall biosynthesis